MNYEQALQYIHAVQWAGHKPGLTRTRTLLAALGDPHKQLKFVHIAGTNGKGSTAAMVASCLQAAGYRVGLYTSPFINRFNERIQVNGEQISDDALVRLVEQVQPAADAMQDVPTEFEIITALGMLYFAQQKCDIVVLEVGLGGTLDSTNVIDPPACAVITALGMDHVKELGPTIADIAAAKAGIIKEGCPVVYDGTREDVSEVIEAYAAQMHSRAYVIRPEMYKILMNTHKTIDFSMDTGYYEPMDVSIDSVAEYQIMNAMEAVTAAEVMDIGLTEEDIHRGMERMHWQGRMETVLPGVILDGAHNDSGVEEFVKTARKFQKDTKLTLLFSCVKEKDYDGMIRTICESLDFESVVVTQIDSYRQVPSEELAQIFRKYTTRPVEEISFIDDAFDEAMKRKGDGVLFCVGSLYLVGSLKSLIRSRKNA